VAVPQLRAGGHEVVEVDVAEPAGAVEVRRPQKRALDDEDLSFGEPLFTFQRLRAGVREVGDERYHVEVANRLTLAPQASQPIRGKPHQLGAQARSDPLEAAAERVDPMAGREEAQAEIPTQLHDVARSDGPHIDVVGRAALEPGTEVQQLHDVCRERTRREHVSTTDALQVALAGPRWKSEEMIEVTVRDDHVLHWDQSAGGAAGVQSEAQLGQEHERAFPGP